MKFSGLILAAIVLAFTSCKQKSNFNVDFDNINDRVWVGKDFWSVPLEDWKVQDGKLYCTGDVPNSRVNVLTHILSPEAGEFNVSANISLIEKGRGSRLCRIPGWPV